MTSLADIYPRKLDLGRVAQDTFHLLGRRPLLYFGLSLVLAGGMSVISNYIRLEHWMDFDVYDVDFHGHGPGMLLSFLLAAFLDGSLLYLSFAEMAGRKPDLREVLSAGAKFFLPLFVVRLIYWICVALGMVLLIAPGVMLALVWLVAAPALIVERGELMDCFRRSAELTRDNRWRLLGLVVICGLAFAIIEGILGGHSFYGGGWMDFLETPRWVATKAVMATLSNAVFYAGLAATYAQLRQLREGVAPETLLAAEDRPAGP